METIQGGAFLPYHGTGCSYNGQASDEGCTSIDIMPYMLTDGYFTDFKVGEMRSISLYDYIDNLDDIDSCGWDDEYLPEGLSFDSTSFTLSGCPVSAGKYIFRFHGRTPDEIIDKIYSINIISEDTKPYEEPVGNNTPGESNIEPEEGEHDSYNGNDSSNGKVGSGGGGCNTDVNVAGFFLVLMMLLQKRRE